MKNGIGRKVMQFLKVSKMAYVSSNSLLSLPKFDSIITSGPTVLLNLLLRLPCGWVAFYGGV